MSLFASRRCSAKQAQPKAVASTTAGQVASLVTAHRVCENPGFNIRRALPSGGHEYADPFLLFDQAGPSYYAPGEAMDMLPFPYRGFETVKYVLEGIAEERDTHGNHMVYQPGWVRWTTAGAGIINGFRLSDEQLKNGGVYHGFYIWINLPAKDKMARPRYQDIAPENIPWFTSADKKTIIKVIAGRVEGVRASIETGTPIYFLDLRTTDKYSVAIPADMKVLVYNYHPTAVLVGREKARVVEGQLAIINAGGDAIDIEVADATHDGAASNEARVLVLAAAPIGEKMVRRGPFVLSSEEELHQAMLDMSTRNFAEIPATTERRARD